MVQTPKGVVSEKFGKEGKEESENETKRSAEILEKVGKKGQKRVRYLGDDTVKEEQSEIESEDIEGSTEEIPENMEVNYERRATGKGRRLNKEETQIKEGVEERKKDKQAKQDPKTFSEIFYKLRKPSWPEEETSIDKKNQEDSTPVKEKIRRWEVKEREGRACKGDKKEGKERNVKVRNETE